jgi:hypothetical protein
MNAREREKEKESERVRELKIKNKKIGEKEGQCVRGRIKNSLLLWHPSITLPGIGGERGRKN